MNRRFLGSLLLAATMASGAAQAAVLEFDVFGVSSSQGSLGGTFQFDTDIQSVTDISVIGGNGFGSVSYESTGSAEAKLVRDGTDASPWDFTSIELYADSSKTSLLRFDIANFQTVMPGLAIGDELFMNVGGFEIAAGVGSSRFLDSTIVIKRLNDVGGPSPVPLPAGLPLLLVGLGSFGLLRKKMS